MTEILVTETAAPVVTPPVAEGAPPATPAPEAAAAAEAQAKADAELQAQRKEIREIADAEARAWKAQQSAKQANARIAELEAARKADLERISRADAYDAMWKDPAKVLEKLEENGLTPQQLGKAVLERGTPDEILAKARKIASEEANTALKRILDERDTEAKRQSDERARVEAFDSWQKTIIAAENEYPATTALLSAGPMMRDLVRNQAFRIYALAADEAKEGRTYSEEQINKSLETFLAKEYGSLTERKSASAQQPSSANGASGQTAKSAAGAPSVTESRGADMASLTSELPKDFKSWPEDKQNQYWIDQARKSAKR